MLDVLWNLAMFVIALGLLVTVHEYGHYWVARRNGVMVKRFCVGFGKVIFSRYDKHGTEFAIAAIPLGGYVRMLDERIEEVPEALRDQSFNAKTVGQRMAIIFAGPAANFIFAVFALWLMYMIGETERRPVIGSVEQGSIIERSGIKPGSEILSVNGKPVLDWNSVNLAMVPSIGSDEMTIETINRDTKRQTTHVLDLRGENLDRQNQHLFKTLGFSVYRPEVKTEVAAITKGSASEAAGLAVGDKIVRIGNQIEPTWPEMVRLIQGSPNTALEFEIIRNGERLIKNVVPQSRGRDGRQEGFIGVAPVYETWQDKYLVHIQYGPIDAFVLGIEKTWDLIKLSFVMLGKLITNDVSVKNLSGPISIAQGAGHSADAGLVKFLWFLALISVNLGVINLLPLPILDGGHLFYYTIELIRGKSVSERAQQIGFAFGAVVLFMLMGIALLNDFSRLS